MKNLFLLTLTILAIESCFAQSPLQIGITAEGGYFFPKKTHEDLDDMKSGYMAGAGVWVMKEFHQRFAVDAGLTYRQKTYQQGIAGYFNPEHTEFHHETPNPLIRFYQNLLAIPLHIRFYPTKKFFLTTGIEHAFMVGLDTDLRKESEDNWMFGFGGQPGKLSWTLTYTQGFEDRGAVRIIDNEKVYTSGYINRIIQLSLFYPIWQKK